MKIEEFIDLLFAVCKENHVDNLDVSEITDILNIIFSSDEFKYLTDMLDINDLDGKKIDKNKYIEDIDQDGIITLNMEESEKEKIKKNNSVGFMFLEDAFIKNRLNKELRESTDGQIVFEVEHPDADYELDYISYPMEEVEQRLYTDGNVKVYPQESKEELYQKKRCVTVSDSTYSIIINYKKNKPYYAEIRGISLGNYALICDEALKLMKNDISSYKVVESEKPKVLRLFWN